MELNYGIVYAILYIQNVQSALTNKNWKLFFWHDIHRCCLMLLLLSHYYFHYFLLLSLSLLLLLLLLPWSLSLWLFFELLSTLHFALCSCSPDIIYTCRLHELGAHKSLLLPSLSKLDFIVLLDNCCPLMLNCVLVWLSDFLYTTLAINVFHCHCHYREFASFVL